MDDQAKVPKLQLANHNSQVAQEREAMEPLPQPRMPSQDVEDTAGMSCPICQAPSRNRFCQAHETAYRNILGAYEAWREAIEIPWNRYLEDVVKNPYTGRWARDTCLFL